MSRSFKGQISASLGDTTYVLVMDFNAMAEFEENTGKNAMDVMAAVEKGKASASDLRSLLHAAMLTHQPDATVREAGDLLSEDVHVIGLLIASCAPKAEAGAVEAARGNVKARKPNRA